MTVCARVWLQVGGIVTVEDTPLGLQLGGVVTGLPPLARGRGGWHVHEGHTCSEDAGVKGHYTARGGADPWLDVKYDTDASGVAHLDRLMPDYSLTLADKYPVLG